MMRRVTLLPLLLLPLGSACSNTVSGSVDGEAHHRIHSALFDETELNIPFVDDATFLRVVITDIPDACETIGDLLDAADDGDCAEQCVDLGAIVEEQLGQDDYFGVSLTLNADNEVARLYYYDPQLSADTFLASYERWDVSAVYDGAACEDECSEGDGPIVQQSDEAETGALEITDYTSLSQVKGTYDIDFGGGDSLEGRFDAERCDMSEWVWWL